jgi:hypothetical protein
VTTRGYDLGCAHDPPRHARSESRIGFEIIVHFIERLVQRGEHFRRENRIDLLIG